MNGVLLLGDAVTTNQDAVANALTSGLNAEAFWGAISPFMGVIITVTVVSLSWMIIKRITKRFSRGKGGA